MGDKVSAKQAMIKAGVPCVPGSEGALPDDPKETIRRRRAAVGYPVIIKAAGGGGGRGMRVVHTEAALRQRGADDAGRGRRGVRQPGGLHGEVPRRTRATSRSRSSPTSTRTRSGSASATARCSGATRRSSRKRRRRASRASVIEKIGERCAAACKKIGYRGAGTFEFLYENGEFYLHRDEHARAGRAPGDRAGSPASTSCRCRSGRRRREAALRAARHRSCAATRSSAASTPRTRTSSRRRRAASRCGTRRAARACASTRTSTPTTSCRRTTTR